MGKTFAYPYFGIVLMLVFIFPFTVVLLCVKTEGRCMANGLHFFEWFWLSLVFLYVYDLRRYDKFWLTNLH